ESNTFTVACKLTVAHPSPLKPPPPKPPDSSISRYSKEEFFAADIRFTGKLAVISSDINFAPAPPPDLLSPPFLSKSLLNNSLSRPPEMVSYLIMAPPPPPKPPDEKPPIYLSQSLSHAFAFLRVCLSYAFSFLSLEKVEKAL
ncbi:hypothetical protein A2U01_0047877, partial [Trifolium medium]|nr:hypothetical protein [Trifolium medium]